MNGRKGKLTRKVMRSLVEYTQTHGNLRYFGNHRCLSQSEESNCMWTHGKNGITRVFMKGWHFTMCLRTFTLFWSRKASVIAKISQVSLCLCTFNRRSCHFSGEFSLSFHSLSYPYFGTMLSTWHFKLISLKKKWKFSFETAPKLL
jgi:hypothetical protein